MAGQKSYNCLVLVSLMFLLYTSVDNLLNIRRIVKILEAQTGAILSMNDVLNILKEAL